MSNFFLKNFLRLWFVKYGSLANIDKSYIKGMLLDEFHKSKFDNLHDFTFNYVGYENDSNLSPSDRFKLRSDIMKNIDNPVFWNDNAEKYKVKHTSEVVEIFKYLKVQGLGKEYISKQSSDLYFPRFQKFLEDNEGLVKIFCSGSSLVKTNYINASGNPIDLSTIINSLLCTSSKEFTKIADKIKLNFSKVLNFTPSTANKVTPNQIFIRKEVLAKYRLEDTCKFLIYSAVMRCDRIPLDLLNLYYNYIPKTTDLFNINDSDFLYLIDLGILIGKPVAELANYVGYKIPDLNDMVKTTGGIYLVYGTKVSFIPETAISAKSIPCLLELEDFSDLVNKGTITEISYNNGLPYLHGSKLF